MNSQGSLPAFSVPSGNEQARRRGGSKGSNEPPLKINNGGPKINETLITSHLNCVLVVTG